jgi:hypothetical protein
MHHEIPPHLHYDSDRVSTIILFCDIGKHFSTRFLTQNRMDSQQNMFLPPKGDHGYDPQSPDMNSIFIGMGNNFKSGTLNGFNNIQVYGILSHLLKIPSLINDGSQEWLTKFIENYLE